MADVARLSSYLDWLLVACFLLCVPLCLPMHCLSCLSFLLAFYPTIHIADPVIVLVAWCCWIVRFLKQRTFTILVAGPG